MTGRALVLLALLVGCGSAGGTETLGPDAPMAPGSCSTGGSLCDGGVCVHGTCRPQCFPSFPRCGDGLVEAHANRDTADVCYCVPADEPVCSTLPPGAPAADLQACRLVDPASWPVVCPTGADPGDSFVSDGVLCSRDPV